MKKAGGGAQCSFETASDSKCEVACRGLLTAHGSLVLAHIFLDGSELTDLPRRGESTPYNTPRKKKNPAAEGVAGGAEVARYEP